MDKKNNEEKLKLGLFLEIFLSFIIVIFITIISLMYDNLPGYINNSNIFLLLLKLFFIIVISFVLTYFITSNLSKTYNLLKKSIRKLKNSNIRDRIIVDEDYIFYDLLKDLNSVRDNMESKLKEIKYNVNEIKSKLDQEELEKINENIREIEYLFEKNNYK